MFFQRYFAQKHAKENAKAVKADKKRKSKHDDDEDEDADEDEDEDEEDRRASGDSDVEEDEIWKVGAFSFWRGCWGLMIDLGDESVNADGSWR